MTISEILKKSAEILRNANIESASLDCRLLLCAFLKVDKLYLIVHPDESVGNTEEFFGLVKRRASHEPMQYILGYAEFMGLRFKVDNNVLIPRPDTEICVEYLIDLIGSSPAHILDIGTGSGCIPISILKNCPGCVASAVDISEKALEIARENAFQNGVSQRIEFTKTDILSDFPKEDFDFIVSNPPYIRDGVIPRLMSDVKDFEPYGALSGGADGLVFYRRIAAEAAKHITPDGSLVFEIGYDQAEDVLGILKANGYSEIKVIKDLSGNDRVVTAKIL